MHIYHGKLLIWPLFYQSKNLATMTFIVLQASLVFLHTCESGDVESEQIWVS